MKLNMDWPSVKQDGAGTWPPANPNWFKQQDLMSSLGPFMGMGMGGGGGGQAPAQAAPAEAEAKEEEVKEETKKAIRKFVSRLRGKHRIIEGLRPL